MVIKVECYLRLLRLTGVLGKEEGVLCRGDFTKSGKSFVGLRNKPRTSGETAEGIFRAAIRALSISGVLGDSVFFGLRGDFNLFGVPEPESILCLLGVGAWLDVKGRFLLGEAQSMSCSNGCLNNARDAVGFASFFIGDLIRLIILGFLGDLKGIDSSVKKVNWTFIANRKKLLFYIPRLFNHFVISVNLDGAEDGRFVKASLILLAFDGVNETPDWPLFTGEKSPFVTFVLQPNSKDGKHDLYFQIN